MIRGEKLEFSYNKTDTFIKNLDINIPKGKITTILGPNGCGKSTLLSLLSCCNKLKRGDVFIGELKINKLKYKDIAKLIATVHQENQAPDDLSVETLINYGRTPHKTSTKEYDKQVLNRVIEATSLGNLKDKKVTSLSGGQRQRAFIAMALAQETDVLFLDEPTTYLDIYHQIEVLEIIKKLNKDHKITIVMVLHDINQAIKYSDNIIVMKSGMIIKNGKPRDVINKDVIKNVYNVEGFIEERNNELYFIPLKVC